MLKKWILTFTLLVGVTYSQGQTGSSSGNFEGSIVYSFELSGEMATMLKTFLPESMTIRVRENDMLMSLDGGIMAAMGKFLMLGDKNEVYMIDDSKKKVMKVPPRSKELKTQEPVVVKESEVITIAGFPCTKYRVGTRNKDGNARISYIWATEKLQFPGKKSPSNGNEQFQNFMLKGVKGVPLKMINQHPQLGTITLTATRVNPEKAPPGLFTLPSDYSMEEFDPMKKGF